MPYLPPLQRQNSPDRASLKQVVAVLKNASAKPAQDKMPGTPIKNETVPLAKAVKRSFDQFALARPKAHEVIRDVECLTAQEDVLLKADEEIKDLDDKVPALSQHQQGAEHLP